MAALLDGVRVLDFTQVYSGPLMTRYLAELGADVLKIEPPRGDTTRATATVRDGRSGFFVNANRGKRSLAVDLKHPDGRDIVDRLIDDVDVLVENFTPGVIERLGFGWERVHERNPRLIMCSISGFGQRGPLADRPGYDGVAAAYAGITALNGEIGKPPVVSGAAVGDTLTGVNGVAGILGALYHRERFGEGQLVEVSLLDSFLQAHESALQSYSVSRGEVVQTRSGQHHPIAVAYGVFDTADGYLFVAAPPDRNWVALCEALGLDELAASDHPWRDRRAREADHDRCNAVVATRLAELTRAEALAALQAHHVPAAPILEIDEVARDPDLRAAGSVTTVSDPVLGELDVAGTPIRFSGAAPIGGTEAPFLGEHNHEIAVGMAGLNPDEYDRLCTSGVLVAEPVRPRGSRQRVQE